MPVTGAFHPEPAPAECSYKRRPASRTPLIHSFRQPFDLVNHITDRDDRLSFLVRDLDIKRILDLHNNLEDVQRIRTEIIHKCGLSGDLLRLQIQ